MKARSPRDGDIARNLSCAKLEARFHSYLYTKLSFNVLLGHNVELQHKYVLAPVPSDQKTVSVYLQSIRLRTAERDVGNV